MKKNRIISFISAKGGSGKTIISISIGKFLSELGFKVLIIDADFATNGMSLFYLDKISQASKSNERNLRGLFDKPFLYDEKNHLKVSDNLFLFPATYLFDNYIEFNSGEFADRIKKFIDFVKSSDLYDFIIFDNQAGSEGHTKVIIDKEISDDVLIVSEYDPMSAAGIERLKAIFRDQLTYDRTWVILNKVLPDLIDEKSSFLEISKYLPPIIWNSEVVKSYSRKEVPLDFKYGNLFTLSIIKVIDKLITTEEKELLQEYLKEKESIIKKPIYDEYSKVQERLIIYEKKKKNTSVFKSAKFISRFLVLLSMIFVTIAILSNYFGIAVFKSLDLNIGFELVPIFLTIIVLVVQISRYSISSDSESVSDFERGILKDRLKTLSIQRDLSIKELLKGD